MRLIAELAELGGLTASLTWPNLGGTLLKILCHADYDGTSMACKLINPSPGFAGHLNLCPAGVPP